MGLAEMLEKISGKEYVLEIEDEVEKEKVEINMRLLETSEVVKLISYAQQLEKGHANALENMIKLITRIVLEVNPYSADLLGDKMTPQEYEKAMEIFVRRNFGQIMNDIREKNFPSTGDVPEEIKELAQRRNGR